MTISIPNGGFIEIDDDKYWSLSDEELFEKMRSKIKFEGYDYYKILGVSRDDDILDIKRINQILNENIIKN